MATKQTSAHNGLLLELCTMLRNCANCKTCNGNQVIRELESYAGLGITDEAYFYLEPYDEKTNAKIIDAAERFGYDAGVITDRGNEYIEFVKR